MTNAGDIGISENDFVNGPLNDLGVTVNWYDATKTTDNITGQEVLSYASGVQKTVVFVKRIQRYAQTAEGLVDLGDAVCYVDKDEDFAKDDKIEWNNEFFIIRSVILREADNEAMFKTCVLEKIED